MNPKVNGIDPRLLRKDAIFFSTHKMIGGVDTPGILLAKKRLFKNGETHKTSSSPGGGTVFFVILSFNKEVNNRFFLNSTFLTR